MIIHAFLLCAARGFKFRFEFELEFEFELIELLSLELIELE